MKKGGRLPYPLSLNCCASLEARPPLLRNDVDVGMLLDALDAKLDDTVSFGEQGVISADADVDAGAINCAALANQDVARKHILAAEFLDAETLGMRVAAVTSTAACFFVCHEGLSCLN